MVVIKARGQVGRGVVKPKLFCSHHVVAEDFAPSFHHLAKEIRLSVKTSCTRSDLPLALVLTIVSSFDIGLVTEYLGDGGRSPFSG